MSDGKSLLLGGEQGEGAFELSGRMKVKNFDRILIEKLFWVKEDKHCRKMWIYILIEKLFSFCNQKWRMLR